MQSLALIFFQFTYAMLFRYKELLIDLFAELSENKRSDWTERFLIFIELEDKGTEKNIEPLKLIQSSHTQDYDKNFTKWHNNSCTLGVLDIMLLV